MGLLDFDLSKALNSEQGRLGLGLLAAAGPSNMGFGQRLQSALGYVQGQQDRDMQKQMQQFQMQDLMAQAQKRKRDAEMQAQADAEEKAVNELAKRFMTQPLAARPATDDVNAALPDYMRITPTPGAPAQAGGFDQKAFLQNLPSVLNPLKAMEYTKKFAPKEVEFSTAPQFTPDGRAYLIGKDGSVKWLDGGIKPRDKLVETNLGGKVGLRSEYSPAIVAELAKTVTPDAQLSANTAMRGQNMTDARSRDANNIAKQLGITEKELKIEDMQAKREDRIRSKEGAKASVINQIAVIDKALSHPGRETATGLSGTLNPTNYIPGTDATDFRAVLDQIGGTAFLQAFESLKGGGAITEVEGKKATDAIARLNRAQSDAEFEKSLKDLRSVMAAGAQRLGATPQTGGASGSFDTPKMPEGFRVIR